MSSDVLRRLLRHYQFERRHPQKKKKKTSFLQTKINKKFQNQFTKSLSKTNNSIFSSSSSTFKLSLVTPSTRSQRKLISTLMSSQIEIFMDWLSQPSRAVAVFCNINKIPTDISEVKVLKQQVRSQEYKKLNPSMKIPTIRDGTFVLYESHAILRYLAARENIPEFWYPKDIKARALVDQYLDWHHTNTRNAGTYIFHSTVLPMMGLQSRHKDDIIKKQFLFAFNIIEKVYLADKPFIASRDQPTIADISCYCELMQMHLISFDFTPYPNIRDWMKRLAQRFPELIEGHEYFMKFVQKHGIRPKL